MLQTNSVFSADYYWVGGTGQWNELIHWATTSGGSTKHTIVPSVLDNVIFDINSFSASGQSVTLNQEAYCKDFKWDGVANNPTFTGAGYTLNVAGKFLALGTPFNFNHANGNLIIGGDFLVDGSNMAFTKNSGTMTVSGKFDIKNVSTMSFSRSGTLQISGGAMNFTDATLTSFTTTAINITTGSMVFTNSKTTGTFSGGSITLSNGGISIPGWSGGNFATGTISMTDSLIINNWTSGNLSTGSITSSAGNISISNWTVGNITMGSIQLSSATNKGGLSFTNATMASFSASGISITNGTIKFNNSKTTGNFNGGTINLGNGGLTIPEWSGGNFTTTSITMTDSLTINNWTSGNLNTGSITSSAGNISISNWTVGSITMGTIQLNSASNRGGLSFTNATMASFSYSSIFIANGNISFTSSKTTGTFSGGNISLSNGGMTVPAWSGGNFSTGSISMTGNLSFNNWTSGTLSCGTISSTNGNVSIDNKTSGNTSLILNLTNGSFNVLNSSGWTLTFTSNCTVGSFLVDQSPIVINFSTNYSFTSNGDFSILNGATSFTHSGTLSVKGNFTLNSSCTFNQSSYVIFTATTTGKTITSAGKTFTFLRFNGSGGEWILQDALKVTNSTEHYTGIFRSNGKSVDYGLAFNADDNGTVRTLDYTGTDTVRVGYSYRLNTSGSTVFTAGSSVLLMQSNVATDFILEGGGKTLGGVVLKNLNNSISAYVVRIRDNNTIYGNVTIEIHNRSFLYIEGSNNTFGNFSIHYNQSTVTSVTESQIYNSHTFGNFTITTNGLLPQLYCGSNNSFGQVSLPAGSNWRIQQSTNQSMKGLTAVGDCQKLIYIYSSNSSVSANIVDTDGGSNTLEFMRFNRINFSGASWTANNTLESINTTGITVNLPPTQTYYWIGGTGNWNDPTKWSLSSGGPAAGCVPVRVDHVVFDNNSFPGSNQTITLNVAAEVINMSWTSGVNASPNFVGSQGLIINGDLAVSGVMDWQLSGPLTLRESIVLNSGVNWSQTNTVTFSGTSSGHTIDMAGKTFPYVVVFDNPGNSAAGSWTLASAFTVSPTYYTNFNDAGLISNGYSIHFGDYFNGSVDAPKVLDFTGTDTVRLQRYWNLPNSVNTSLTMGQAVLLLRQPSGFANSMEFYGGAKTYHDVVIDALNTNTAYSILLSNASTIFRDLFLRISGPQLVNWQHAFSSRHVSVQYFNSSTSYAPSFSLSGNHSMTSLKFISPSVMPVLYLYNSNTIDTLQLHHGMTTYFGANQTQTLKSLTADGICSRRISLYSTSSGTQATLSDLTDTNNVDQLYMRDIRAQGGAVWNADGLVNEGNNTGWTLNPQPVQSYYWIGGTGNWSDSTKWSFSSGGTPANCLPSRQDHVVFDNNSFPGSNQTVTLNIHAEISNMTWTSGVNASPNFSGSNNLILNGNLTISGAMDWILNGGLTLRKSIILSSGVNWSHANLVTFSGTTSGNVINMAGKTFSNTVLFDNPGNSASGSWTLASNFTVSNSYYTNFQDAGFISNGYAVNFGDYLEASSNVPKVLNFTGTDTVRVQRFWNMLNGANANLIMTQAVLLIRQPSGLSNEIYFNGGGKIYSDVVIDAQHASSSYYIYLFNSLTGCRDIYFRISGQQNVYWQDNYTSRNVYVQYLNTNTGYAPNFWVYANNTMSGLKFTSPSVQPRLYLYNFNTIDTLQLHHGMDVYFGASQTQTLKSLSGISLCTRLIDIFSTSTGTQAILTDANGTNSLNFINFRDIRAQGGATWEASNVNTNTNNLGWTIVPPPAITYYWVGGTGNWNDLTKWSLSSGGPSAGCLPTTLDNVVFDINSFNATGQSVNLVTTTLCRNMTWTSGVTLNPGLNGNFQLEVQGDLQVLGTMTWNQSGNLISRGDFILSNSTTWNHNNQTQFYSDSTNNILNTAGKTMLQSISFDARTTASGPKWTLGSDLIVSSSYTLNVVEGQFISDGYEINAGLEFLANSGTDQRIINLSGTDTLRMRRAFRITNNANTSFTHGNATILLSSNLGESLAFEGGNRSYYDVTILQGSNSSSTFDISFSGNNNIRDVKIQTLASTGWRRIYFNNSSVFRHVDIDHFGSNQVLIAIQNGPHTFSNFVLETFGSGLAYVEMSSNNTFSTLDLPNGFDMLLASSTTQTTSNFIPRSSCLKRSTIRGNNSTTSRISQSSGTISTEWITLQNHTVLGGAAFNATDATISGSVFGWNYQTVQPITMYWVGGTGSWSDPNKWAFTSGGPGNGCIIPKSTDHVVFDNASFTAINQTVTLNQSATVVNMIWNNVAFTPNFTGGNPLTVNGNLFINSAMGWNQSGTLNLNGSVTFATSMNWNRTASTTLSPVAGNYTLDFAGKTLNGAMNFNGNANAIWTLLNDYKAATGVTTTFVQGKFFSNGYRVDFGLDFNSNYSNSRLLDLSGTDTVRVRRQWLIGASNLNLNMGGAVLLMQTNQPENQSFAGGNIVYGDLIFLHQNTSDYTINLSGNNTYGSLIFNVTNRKNITLDGNNTMAGFTINMDHSNTASAPQILINGTNSFGNFLILSKNIQGPYVYFYQNNNFVNFTSVGRNTRLNFGANRTQTFIDDVQILGTGSTPILVNSTTGGTQATLSKASGQLCFDYVWIEDINGTGGATYNGGHNSQDLGNNNGITFGQSCVAYYWVGDSGNWSDYANHWATRSGGNVFYNQLPSATDHVVFDANSFTTTGQTVTLDVVGNCYNMTWLSVLFNPSLAGSAQNLNIHGNLFLSPSMNQNWTGRWNLLADDGLIHQINLFGKTLTDVHIEAENNSILKLEANFNYSDSLTLASGHLNTNGKNILGKSFNLIGNASRTLTLGSSEILLNEGVWNVEDPSNLTLSAGTSEIILKSHGDTVTFIGGDLPYYDLRFQTDSVMVSNLSGSNSFNKLLADPGNILTLSSGSTQTTVQLIASGNCQKDLSIQSDTPGSPASFSQASGTVNSNFVDIKDNSATGGATFNANQAADLGGNTGWNFPPFNVLDVSINKTNPTCPTPNNGSATAVVNGGVGPFSYKWNTLSTLATLTNLSQGTYSVTVTDASGCTGTAIATLNQPASYNFGSTTQGETICFGAMNGDVSVDAPGGLAPLTYSWSNGATTQAVSGLSAGTYAVTVIDAANCRAFNSATVISHADINAGNSITTSKCINIPVGFSASGTGTGLSYNWAFGDGNIGSGQMVSNTYDTAGSFTAYVTVTASNGCKDSAGVALTIAPVLDLSANITHVNTCTPNTCNGQVILNPSGGVAPFTYTGPEFAHAFYGPTLSPTLFTKDNNTGAYVQNNQLSVTGNGNWNKRIYTPATFARAAGKEFSFKFFHPAGGLTSIGWHGNGTTSTTNTRADLIYAFSFEATSLFIYEDNNNRSNVTASVPGGYTINTWYEVRIVLKATGAEYYLRKLTGGNYVLLYNSTYSNETSLRLGMCTHTGIAITDDWVVSPVTPILTSLCPGDYKYFVLDANGCVDTFTAAVSITDQTLPVAACKNISVSLDQNGEYTLTPAEVNNNSSDDCGIEMLELDVTNFDCGDIGQNTVLLTVTDSSGNTKTCTSTVTVLDNAAPLVSCPPASISLPVHPGSPCTIAIPDYVAQLNPTDNCTDAGSILEDQSIPAGNFAVSGNGQIVNLSYTATDAASPPNTKTCSIAITVQASVIDVRGNNTTIADGDITPSSTDHTDFGQVSGMPITRTFTIRNTGAADLNLEVGSILVTGPNASFFIVDNISLPATIPGPSGTLTFDVTYDPSAQGVHNATVEITTDNCTIVLYDFAIQGELSCGLPSFTQCPNAPVMEDTDPSLCSEAVNYNVQATGTPAPTLDYEFSGATTDSGSGTGSGESFNKGITTVTVTATNSCGTATCVFDVVVTDDDAPVLDCNTLTTIHLNTTAPDCTNDTDATVPIAVDNCDGNINGVGTRSDMVSMNDPWPLGTTTITWTFTDAASNVKTCTQDVVVTDDDAPVLDCNTLTTIHLNTTAPDCTNDTDATVPIAVDNCDGSINGAGTRSDMVSMNDPWPLGTTTITWTFTDAASNGKSCTQDVVVTDDDAPVLDCMTLTTVNLTTEAPDCDNDTDVSVPVAMDNCDGNINGVGTRSDMASLNDPWPLGTTTITWTFTDAASNGKSCTQDVVVTDDDAPVLDCNTLTTIHLNTTAPDCTNDTDATVPIAVDNCDGNINGAGTRSDMASLNDPWPLGTTTITWTFTDAASNVKTCTQDVVVTDNDAPVLDCNTLTTIHLNTTAPDCTNDTDATVPIAVDNCDGNINGAGTRSDMVSMNAPWPLGTTTITWTFTDAASNVKTCTQDVVVTDDDAPVLDCNTLTTIHLNTTAPDCTNDTDATVPIAVDNCDGNINGVGTRSDMASLNAPWPLGTTTITWTFTDAASNVKTCTQDVSVTDDDAPVLDCMTLTTVNLTTEAPDCDNDTDVSVPVAMDNCDGNINGVGTRSDMVSMNDPWPLGTTTITWTFTDAASNVKTCTQDVVVTDDDAPSLTCPSSGSVNPNPGSCEYTIAGTIYDPSMLDDNCGIAGVENDFNQTSSLDGAVIPAGANVITWTVTDNNNLTNSCSFTVEVVDNQDPIITGCPSNIGPLSNDPGQCGREVSWTAPTASDNCPGVTLEVDPPNANGSFFPVGTTIVTYTATDASGLTTTCQFTVTVSDTEAPQIDCPDDEVVNSAPGECENEIGYDAPIGTDNCPGAITTHESGPMSGEILPVGVHVVVYKVTDAEGLMATCSFTITVVDDEDPTIDCPDDIVDETDPGECGAEIGFDDPMADDNCGIDEVNQTGGLPSGSIFPVGVSEITFEATDIHGNTSTCSFTITITDEEDPEIDCPDDIEVDNDPGLCAALVGFTEPEGTDNCPGAETDRTSGQAPNSYFAVGVTTQTYLVTDASGNTAECSFTVTVNDTEDPQISCPNDIVVSNDAGLCSAVVNYGTPNGTDNCPGVMTSQTAGMPSGSAFPVGVTTNTFEAEDASGNISSCSFTVTVNDTEDPSIDCPANIVVSNDPDECGAEVTYADPTTDDNCPGEDWTQTAGLASGSFFPVGVTTNTFEVEDASGNTAECSFTVTVNDTQDPEISCPSDIAVDNDLDECGADVTYTTPVGTDNCPGEITTQTSGLPSGSFFPVGVTTNTFEVEDASGNITTCSFTVTVTDAQDPEITCPSNIGPLSNDPGLCSKLIGFTEPEGTDNCPGAETERTSGQPPYTYFPVGVTTQTYLVTDASGNTAECSFTVTVVDTEAPIILNCPVARVIEGCDPTAIDLPAFSTTLAATTYAIFNGAPNDGDAIDNCGVTTVEYIDVANGSCPTIVTRTWYLRDAAGNTDQCNQTITVDDTQAPTIDECAVTRNIEGCDTDAITGPDYSEVENESSEEEFENATNQGDASDACGIESVGYIDESTGSCPIVVTRTWFIRDACGNESTCVQTIYVDDTDAPDITECPETRIIEGCGTDDVTDPPFSMSYALSDYSVFSAAPNNGEADDECGIVEVGYQDAASGECPIVITRTWTLKDACGNTETCVQTLEVDDTTDPEIEVCAEDRVIEGCGTGDITSPAYSETEASSSYAEFSSAPNNGEASDECGIISVTYIDEASGTCPITVTRTWTLKDACNNETTCVQIITVDDTEEPVISVCPVTRDIEGCDTDDVTGPDYSETLANSDLIEFEDMPNFGEASDNCEIVSVKYIDESTGTCPIVVTRTWYLEDACGNETTCEQTIYVDDTESPDLDCPANIVVSNNTGVCGNNVNFAATADDECSVPTINYSKAPGSYFVVGTTTVYVTATDACGNPSYCNFTVTVNDTTKPTVITKPKTLYLNAVGQAALLVSHVNNGSFDNCGIVSYSLSKTVFNCSNKGVNVVTLTATDAAGNVGSNTALVTVMDTTRPVAKCKNITIDLIAGTRTITPAQVNNASTDNCGAPGLSINKTTFTCSDPITNNVILTATDGSGNSSTCTAVVTIRGPITCSITLTPATGANTGGIPSNVYLGYGPQTVLMTAVPSGGTGFTYSWSPTTHLINCTNCQSPTFAPTVAGNFTYTVTVTNSQGCSSTCSVTFCVKDVRVPGMPGKVYVCDNGNTIEVDVADVPDYVPGTPGATMGKCDDQCTPPPFGKPAEELWTGGNETDGSNQVITLEENSADGRSVRVFPNPTSQHFDLLIFTKSFEPVDMMVFDMYGKMIERRFINPKTESTHFGSDYPAGVFMLQVKQGDWSKTVRIIKTNK
ncbi:MAG: HYR domain-containing protein [Saprospiraceae bacterium]|nr:HYR domain-containing protein [Saprospiraceae bacterium]